MLKLTPVHNYTPRVGSGNSQTRMHAITSSSCVCMCVCACGAKGAAGPFFKSWPTGLFAERREEGQSSVSSANSASRMWVRVASSRETRELVVVVLRGFRGFQVGGWRFNLSYENICTRLAATDVIELKSRPPKVVCAPGQWIYFEAHDCHSPLAGWLSTTSFPLPRGLNSFNFRWLRCGPKSESLATACGIKTNFRLSGKSTAATKTPCGPSNICNFIWKSPPTSQAENHQQIHTHSSLKTQFQRKINSSSG